MSRGTNSFQRYQFGGDVVVVTVETIRTGYLWWYILACNAGFSSPFTIS